MGFGDLVPGAYSPPVALLSSPWRSGQSRWCIATQRFCAFTPVPSISVDPKSTRIFPVFIPAIISLRAFSEVASWMNRTSLWGMP